MCVRSVVAATGRSQHSRDGRGPSRAIRLDHVPELDYSTIWWERSLRSVPNFTRQAAGEPLVLASSIPIHPERYVHPLDDAHTALEGQSPGGVRGAAVLACG